MSRPYAMPNCQQMIPSRIRREEERAVVPGGREIANVKEHRMELIGIRVMGKYCRPDDIDYRTMEYSAGYRHIYITVKV